MTKVNVEIDLADLLNDTEKADALYAALLETISKDRAWLATVLKTTVIDRVVQDVIGEQLISAVKQEISKKITSTESYGGLAWDVFNSESYKSAVAECIKARNGEIDARVGQIIADEALNDKLVGDVSYRMGDIFADALVNMRNK